MKRVLLLVSLSFLGCSGSGAPSAAAGGSAGSAGSADKASGGESTSGGSASGGSAGSGDQTDKAGSANGGQGGADTSAGAWKTVPISLPLKLRGEMAVTQWAPPGADDQYAIYAQFGMLRGQWDGCTRHQLDNCWYYDCPDGSAPVGTPPVGPLQSIGQSLVVQSPTVKYTLYYDETMTYKDSEFGRFWPNTGGNISFVASGTPAFKLDVPAPPFVQLSSVNGQPVPSITSLKRSTGAKLKWITSGSGRIFFSIYHLTGSAPRAAVCEFDATDLAGELPGSVLEKLDPGSDYELTFRGNERVLSTVEGIELDGLVMTYFKGEEMTVHLSLE